MLSLSIINCAVLTSQQKMSNPAQTQRPEWTFLTNHGHVLTHMAKYPQSTIREMAATVGITERATQKIIAALEADGYVARHKKGRCNNYTINPDLPMRHRMEQEHAVRDLLLALGCKLQRQQVARTKKPQVQKDAE